MTNRELLDMARELTERGVAYALVTVVRAIAPTSAFPGAQAIVLADGTLHGWIGGGCAQDVVVAAAQAAIAKGEPKLVRISNDRMQTEEDIEQHTMSCASNGSVELFIQPYSAKSALCVLGSTPAAEEARFLAERLGISLADIPADAPVVLVATQGQGDEDALEAALKSRARRVLMIASRRKAEKLRGAMRLRGVDEVQLARLVAPAGSDAGAKTPGEIALVAIVAVLAFLRGRSEAAASPTQTVNTPAPTAGSSAPARAPEGTFINPVCGTAVSVAHPKHVETYAGVSYYFCCDGCRTTFLADPGKYAAIHRASSAHISALQRFAALPDAGRYVTAALLVFAWVLQFVGLSQPPALLPAVASGGVVLAAAAALGWLRAARVGLTAPQAMLLLGTIGMALGLAVDVRATPPDALASLCAQADRYLWRMLQLHLAVLPWMHLCMWVGGLAAIPLLRAIRPACRGQFCAGVAQNIACSAWMTVGMSAGALLWDWIASPEIARDPAAMLGAMYAGMVWGMVASVALYRLGRQLRPRSIALRV